MAFDRPMLTELADRVQQDLASRLQLTGAILRRSVVWVLARVIAGAAHLMHGHLEYLSKQVLPDTAEGSYLERLADLFGVRRKAASYAKGTVTFSGTNGTVVDAGTTLVRADGQRYATDADGTISGGSATIAVTAITAGAAGTLVAAQSLTPESPIAGITSTASVAASTTDGANQESNPDLRTRLKERLANPPHGGAEADYVAWAKDVAGVTRAWPYPQELGAGTVTVRFVRDDDGAGAAIIPSAGEITEVQDYIDALRPVTAAVTVLAPVAVVQDFTIHIVPDNATTRAAVEAELADLLRRDVSPGGTLLISQVEVAVGTADGITDFSITSPAGDVTYTTGQLPTMGTVTWT